MTYKSEIIDEVKKACIEMHNEKFDIFTVGNIPVKREINARRQGKIDCEGEIVALVDLTVWGSAKAHVAITSSGFYLRNSWLTSPRDYYLDWKSFSEADIEFLYENENEQKGRQLPYVNSNRIFVLRDKSCEPVYELLSAIQKIAKEKIAGTALSSQSASPKTAAIPPIPPPIKQKLEKEWYVAKDGEQYGPYKESLLREMIGKGNFEADTDYAWCERMENWQLIQTLPEFPVSVPHAAVPDSNKTPDEDQNILVDLNNASIDELLVLPFVKLTTAQKVIELRIKNSGFESVEELRFELDMEPSQFELFSKQAKLKSFKKGNSGQFGAGRRVEF